MERALEPDLPDSPPCPSDFVSVLAAARTGKIEARGELLQRCRGYLLAVASRRLPGELRAKLGGSDLAQEVLTQAHANFDRFDGSSEGELLAWLGRILDFSLLTAQRRYYGTDMRALAREIPLRSAARATGDSNDIVQDTPAPDLRVASKEELARLEGILANMDPVDREIIELRNFQTLSFVEIARQTGRTPDGVRKRWIRAIDRLSEAMGQR